jgi:membrane-bound ClpP family serine protease
LDSAFKLEKINTEPKALARAWRIGRRVPTALLAIALTVGHNMKMTEKTSNILFYSGLILLTIGAFGLTFAAFFAIIGLPVFIVGIILVLASLKKTWKTTTYSNRTFHNGNCSLLAYLESD